MSAALIDIGSAARLAPIPIVDVRDGGPVRHAFEDRARARALQSHLNGGAQMKRMPAKNCI